VGAWDGADLGKCRPRFARVRDVWASPGTWRRFHGSLTVVWILLIIPSLLWWSESIKWVVLMSVWANVAGHFSGWQGSRAEDNATE
jgi:hypothetical protein